jgi:hypothetical protein
MEQRFPQVRAREIEQRNPTFSGVMEAIPELRRELEAGGATPDNHDVIFAAVAWSSRGDPAIDGGRTHARSDRASPAGSGMIITTPSHHDDAAIGRRCVNEQNDLVARMIVRHVLDAHLAGWMALHKSK